MGTCLQSAGDSKPLGLIFLLERALGGASQGSRAGLKKMSVDMYVCFRGVCGLAGRGGKLGICCLIRGPFITRFTFGLLVAGVPRATLSLTCRVVSI